MRLGVDLFWPAYLAAAFVAAAMAAHVFAYRRTPRPIARGEKRLLLVARLAALGLMLFVLWRPAAESEARLTRKARLALLVDTSRSMSIGDEEMGIPPAAVSRLGRASGVFSENKDLWKKILDAYEVTTYSFSKGLAAMPGTPDGLGDKPGFGVAADGAVTAIGDAIRDSARSVNAPEALIIMSDGLNNAGIDPIDAAPAGSAPVYAISVGRAEASASTRDAAVTQVLAQPEAFVSSDVPVVAELALTGLANRTIRVVFRVDGNEVDSREVSTPRDQATQEARFSFKGVKTGPARLEVLAEPLADEIVASNNSAATYVDVKSGKMRILYLEGTFRWETKFIRAALQSAKDIDVRFLMPKAPDDETTAKALADEWDVLIIGDLPASSIPSKAFDAITDAVSTKGKGILFLGGNSAFGKGGYAATPLKDLVPFEISANETVDRGSYTLSPKPVGPSTSMIAVGPDNSTDVWATLAPLMSLNLVGAPKPGAAVLLEGEPVVRDGDSGSLSPDTARKPAPVLAIEELGKGRSAAVTGEGTWQWVTGAGITDPAARDASAEAHRRFWRQLAFWLARREERGEIMVNLSLPRHRVDLGEKVEIDAQLVDPELKPLTDAALTAEIASQGKTTAKKLWLEGDHYRVDFEPPASGDYDVKVTAERGGAKVAERTSAFVVAGTDVEFMTLVSRPSLLEGLARATGGRYAQAANAKDVFADIIDRAKSTNYQKLVRRELWSSYWYFGLIMGLLALEWGLRKKYGLV
jgi:hypothetical protein